MFHPAIVAKDICKQLNTGETPRQRYERISPGVFPFFADVLTCHFSSSCT